MDKHNRLSERFASVSTLSLGGRHTGVGLLCFTYTFYWDTKTLTYCTIHATELTYINSVGGTFGLSGFVIGQINIINHWRHPGHLETVLFWMTVGNNPILAHSFSSYFNSDVSDC